MELLTGFAILSVLSLAFVDAAANFGYGHSTDPTSLCKLKNVIHSTKYVNYAIVLYGEASWPGSSLT